MQTLPEVFETYPIVYAVRDRYIVIVPVNTETVLWIRVGNEEYYDDSNGILRSATVTHKVEIPMEALDREKSYTVCFRRVVQRKSYFSEVGEEETFTSEFRPVSGDKIHAYHISDAHDRVEAPVKCASFFGEDLDLFFLNGDICDTSDREEGGLAMHRIASAVTKGQIPVVFARGNHDTRGKFAERLADHTPTDQGRSYYSVRLGKLWMAVLDCGEDKPDEHEAYGHTMCCHDFRKRETAFLEDLVRHADTEYNAPGVEYRLVMVHNPFTETHNPPFDIEIDTYTKWAKILKEHIHPELMVCGHTHGCYVTPVGGERDHKGQPCPVMCGARPTKERAEFRAAAITLEKEQITVQFTDEKKEIVSETVLPRI